MKIPIRSPWCCLPVVFVLACTPEVFEIPLPSTSTSTSTSGEIETTGGSHGGSEPTSSSAEAETGSVSGSGGGGDCIPVDQWWDPAWSRRRRLEIDPSVLVGVQQDFPVLVRMTAESLGATWSERGGDDVRVRNEAANAPIDYDLDDVDQDGELALWLRLPTVDSAAETIVAWIYYDQPRAAPGSAAADVWTDYISVHHLGSDLRDSANGHHGSSQWEPELCDGDDDCDPLIGNARRFDVDLLHEVVLDEPQSYDLGSDRFDESLSFTVSLWMRSSDFGAYPWGPMIAKGDDTWRIHISGLVAPELSERIAVGLDCVTPECLGAGWVDDFDNFNLVASSNDLPANLDDNAWHQIVAVFEALSMPDVPDVDYVPDTQVRLYIDGQETVVSDVMPGFVLPSDEQPVRLGHNINTANRWGGSLDEVRVMEGARSASAIASDYATVTTEHVTVGEEQQRCP